MSTRDIRFRAWDTKQAKWLTEVPHSEYMLESDEWDMPDYGEIGEALSFYPNNLLGPDFNGRIVYEQFTGNLDKNKREIYEGDIVRIEGEMIGHFFNPLGAVTKTSAHYSWLAKVIWDDGYAQFLFEYINRPTYQGRGHFCGTAPWSEVLGNIHESPHLLLSS